MRSGTDRRISEKILEIDFEPQFGSKTIFVEY